jgi:hypothetical protein
MRWYRSNGCRSRGAGRFRHDRRTDTVRDAGIVPRGLWAPSCTGGVGIRLWRGGSVRVSVARCSVVPAAGSGSARDCCSASRRVGVGGVVVTAAVIVGAVLAVVALWAAGSGRRRRCRGVAVSRCPAVVAPGRGVRRGARSRCPSWRPVVGIRSRCPAVSSRCRIPNPSRYRKFASRIGLPEFCYRNSDSGIGFHDLGFANRSGSLNP